MQFFLAHEVSTIELESELVRSYIEIYNDLNDGDPKKYFIHIRLHDLGEVDMVMYSLESDQIFNHFLISKLEDTKESFDTHNDIMYLIDEKCNFEFRQEPAIVFTITKKIPLALVKSVDLNEFLKEYNQRGSFIRVKIETSVVYLTWFSEPSHDGFIEDFTLSFEISSLEFEDMNRLSRYFKIKILENSTSATI